MRKPDNARRGSGRAVRRAGQRGLTLIELVVVLLLAGILIGAVAMAFRSIDVQSVKSSARRIAAALRFGYDRARAQGHDMRLVIDFGAGGGTSARLETGGAERALMPASLDDAWKANRALTDGEEGRDLQELEAKTTKGGLTKGLESIKRPKGPAWKPYPFVIKSQAVRLAKAARFIQSVYLARLEREVSEGKAALYIYRDGRIERAAIYIGEKDKDPAFTLVTHPLTGRVVIYAGRKEIGNKATTDDVGESTRPEDDD